MRARLAFTVATVVSPEILLIDEALAVGDRSFKSRASERLAEISEGAGSVIVVSHSLNELSNMCTRGIWLEKGDLLADGDIDDILGMYEDANPVEKKRSAKSNPEPIPKPAGKTKKPKGQSESVASEATSDPEVAAAPTAEG